MYLSICIYMYICIYIYVYIYIIIIYICIPVYPHDIPRSLSQMSPWPHLPAPPRKDGVIPHGLEGFLGVVATLGSALARLAVLGESAVGAWSVIHIHIYIYILTIYIY